MKIIKLTKPIGSNSFEKASSDSNKRKQNEEAKGQGARGDAGTVHVGTTIGVSLLTAMPDPRALEQQEDGGAAGWGRLSWWGHKSIEDLHRLHETSTSCFTSHCTYTLTTQSSRSLDKTTQAWFVLKERMTFQPHHPNRRTGLPVLQCVLEHSWIAPVPTQQKALHCRAPLRLVDDQLR